ncbi:gamma-glutamylcyclotransferase [Rhodovulum sp. DZ06]|uniref:gamma-glutamylcyclotransferase n=1 Tax=Rhodovulum sp. DZ06 TaxID=3425126 RepID=UPI003D3252EE
MTTPLPRPAPAGPLATGDLWVFGYGSLLWRPGFEHAETRRAAAPGWRRAFCLRSIRYRGTTDFPGLVLALDFAPHMACEGLAFRVPPEHVQAARDYLHEREMGTRSYLECWPELVLEDGTRVRGLAYAIDRTHPSYVRLPLSEQADIIARAHGPAGPNAEYLHNTAAHLRELGVHDAELEALDARVRELAG